MLEMYHLNIDLGTTNTVAYIYNNGNVEYVRMDNKRLLPSFVEFRKDKSVIVGESAKRAYRQRGKCTISNSKRIIGRTFDSPEVHEMKKYCGTAIINRNNKPYFKIVSQQIEVSPEDIAKVIVKKVIQCSYAQANKTLDGISISVPAHFNNNQMTATIQAVRDALNELDGTVPMVDSLQVLSLREPTAAAYCYFHNNTEKQANVLVYDFGGGTFDVSIVRISNEDVTVLTTRGNNHLGGNSIDIKLCEFFIQKYKEDFQQDYIPESAMAEIKQDMYRKLQDYLEEKKRILSSVEKVDVEYLNINNLVEEDEEPPSFQLTQSMLNELIRDIIMETMTCVRESLQSVSMKPEDIDMVVLVGGSSNIQMVGEQLSQMFGKEKIRHTVDSALCVAEGGLYWLHDQLESKEKAKEVTTFSLETSIQGERSYCVIPKGVPIPCSGEVVFGISYDYMQKVQSRLIQGSSSKKGEQHAISEGVIIGNYQYDGFRTDLIGNVSFIERYSYSKYGVVHIQVIERETNKVLLDKDISWRDCQSCIC